MEKKLVMCGILLIFVIGGCATKQSYLVKIDATADQQIAESSKNYFLLPLDSGLSSEDPEYKEFADQIRQLLQANGYISAADFAQAECVIFMKYGNAVKNDSQMELIPVFGQVGTELSRTRGSYDSSSEKYASTSYSVPKYGIVGYTPRQQMKKTVTGYLYLVAFSVDLKKKELGPGKQLWQLSATITDSSEGLKVVFPTLLMTVKDYLGKNTRQIVQVPNYCK